MTQCDRCGAPTPGIFLNTENGLIALCPKCSGLTGYCHTCKNGITCPFETDTSIPEPKVVLRTVMQGNMRAQTQVRNPAREEKTCYSCPCWDKEDKVCNAQNAHTCGNYDLTTFWRR